MINLFIHILRFPNLPSVSSDIQLMEMVAAYFGYLDFSTASYLAFPFTRDIAHWARAVYDKARLSNVAEMSPPLSSTEMFTDGFEAEPFAVRTPHITEYFTFTTRTDSGHI